MSWLIDTLVTTGALIVLVLLLRRPVSRHFGPGMAYALWGLPLLRLFLPPLVLPAAPVQVAASEAVMVSGGLANAAVATTPTLSFAWVEPLLIGLWLAGAVGFLVWRLLGYRALRSELLASARPVGTVDGIRLVETPAAPTPLAFGLTDKVIALPHGFMAQPDQTARDLAIVHELEHHRGRDLAVNMAMQPLLALHWFNPLAWLAWRALRRDQEAACDARVVAGRDAAIRAAYGAMIADYARAPRVSLAASIACPVVGEASVIHRLRSLTMSDPTPARRNLGHLLLAAAALALPLTASVTYAAAQDAAAPPAPPVPPAAPAAPEAPEAPKVVKQHRIVIVDKEGGATVDDPDLKTRIVTKDGKTIVFKSDKALSEKEIEARVEKALASIPDMPDLPMPPEGAGPRVVLKRVHGDGAPHVMAFSGADPKVAIACADGAKISTFESEKPAVDGKKQKVVMRFCSAGAALAKAADGLKSARDRISKDDKLSPAIREDIVKQLDAEIERLSKQG
jgi:bla regulator protein BlaR1